MSNRRSGISLDLLRSGHRAHRDWSLPLRTDRDTWPASSARPPSRGVRLTLGFESRDEIEYLPSLGLGKGADFVIDVVGRAHRR